VTHVFAALRLADPPPGLGRGSLLVESIADRPTVRVTQHADRLAWEYQPIGRIVAQSTVVGAVVLLRWPDAPDRAHVVVFVCQPDPLLQFLRLSDFHAFPTLSDLDRFLLGGRHRDDDLDEAWHDDPGDDSATYDDTPVVRGHTHQTWAVRCIPTLEAGGIKTMPTYTPMPEHNAHSVTSGPHPSLARVFGLLGLHPPPPGRAIVLVNIESLSDGDVHRDDRGMVRYQRIGQIVATLGNAEHRHTVGAVVLFRWAIVANAKAHAVVFLWQPLPYVTLDQRNNRRIVL
jgi:hypothetical protein